MSQYSTISYHNSNLKTKYSIDCLIRIISQSIFSYELTKASLSHLKFISFQAPDTAQYSRLFIKMEIVVRKNLKREIMITICRDDEQLGEWQC